MSLPGAAWGGEAARRELTPGGTRTMEEYHDFLADAVSFTSSDIEDLSQDPREVFRGDVRELQRENAQSQRTLSVGNEQRQREDNSCPAQLRRGEFRPTAPMYGDSGPTGQHCSRIEDTLMSTAFLRGPQSAPALPLSSNNVDPYGQSGMRDAFATTMRTPRSSGYEPQIPALGLHQAQLDVQYAGPQAAFGPRPMDSPSVTPPGIFTSRQSHNAQEEQPEQQQTDALTQESSVLLKRKQRQRPSQLRTAPQLTEEAFRERRARRRLDNSAQLLTESAVVPTKLVGAYIDVSATSPQPFRQGRKRPAAALEVESGKEAEELSAEIPSTAQVLRKKRAVIKKNGKLKAKIAGDEWEDAIYHDDIRYQLLRKTDQLGSYHVDCEPAAGEANDDQTAYLASQRTWRCHGTDRPPILYQFDKVSAQQPTYNPVQWYWHGFLVLDADNYGMIDWQDVPATVSSEVEGWRYLAWKRTDVRINARDIRGRMPKKNRPAVPTLSHRAKNFRESNWLYPWYAANRERTHRNILWGMMPETNRQSNSTRGLDPLTPAQLTTINTQLRRATPRALRTKKQKKSPSADEEGNEYGIGGDGVMDYSHHPPRNDEE